MSKNLVDDIKKASVQLLDDDELEQVNGGRKDYEDWCWYEYCCMVLFMHPIDAEPGDACYWNFS